MSADARGDVSPDSELVARVAEVVHDPRPLPRVLDRVVGLLAEHGYPGAGITLINERDELYVVAYDGPPDEDILALRLPVGEGIMGTVAAECRPLLVADLDTHQGPAPANRAVGGHARLRSILAVPIVTDHSVIGVLEIDSTEPGRFVAADQRVFETVASEIARAVSESAPLELAGALLRRRVHELMILAEATRALSATVDLSVVCEAVVRYAALGLGSPRVLLLETRDGGASVVAEHGEPAAAPGHDTGSIQRLPTLAGSRDGEPAFLTGSEVESGLGLPAGSLAGRTVAAVPCGHGSDFGGVLLAAARTSHGFDPAELRLLNGIADLAGLAIGNAERFGRLAAAADTDVVTHLNNRARFERDLAAHSGSPLAVLSIDLDRLKLTNDTYGHEAGDAVLEHVAEALDKIVGARGAVARTGADEFAVLLPGASAIDATALAEDMRQSMYGLVPPFGTARISVGVAAAMAGADARITWSAADAALRRAKQWGRDRVECAGEDTPPASHHPTRWDDDVVTLIDTRAIESVYQPIVRLGDHGVLGFEALARPIGADPDLSVEGLFAAAHRTGWSRELDWLSRRAAAQGSRSLPAGGPLFVNCSIGALLNPVHDVDQMLLLLDWADRSPADVVLEITEREAVDDLDRFRDVLAAYRAHGFRFAIDDVGEGRSTLEVLAQAEPEFVKIARSLTVTSHLLGPRSAILAVAAFARSSGAVIIAEGIEDERHAEMMAAMDIDHGQGWWLGHPARLDQNGGAR